jgi:cell division transport system permease protein
VPVRLVLGVGMLLMINVHHIANTVESNVEIMVYLKDDISEDEASSMEPIFYRVSGVEEVFFIPPDEGLELLEGWMGEGSDLGSLSEENFLPNAYKVKTGDPHEVGDAAAEIERVPGVEKVRYEQGVVEKLFALTNWVRIIGLIVIVLLAASAIFLIATTTRLTFFARSREINIMKYVGATDWFVRWPFLLEGVILGCIGALLTVGILYLSYGMLTVKLQQTITFLPLVTDSNDMLTIYGVLLGLGVLLGAIGSSISMRKYLRV